MLFEIILSSYTYFDIAYRTFSDTPLLCYSKLWVNHFNNIISKKRKYGEERREFKFDQKQEFFFIKYQKIIFCAQNVITIYRTTYSCESLYLTVKIIKSKYHYRSNLTDNRLTKLLTTLFYNPDFEKLNKKKNKHATNTLKLKTFKIIKYLYKDYIKTQIII